MISDTEFAKLKPGAIVVNTARGGIIDEQALADALRSGHVLAAGIDVFEEEPAKATNPLLGLDNVIVTPHSLCWTDQCFAGIGACDVRAALAVMAGEVPEGIVNSEIVDAAGWRTKLAANARRFG